MHLQFIDLIFRQIASQNAINGFSGTIDFKIFPRASPRLPCISRVYDARPYINYKEERGRQILSWPRATATGSRHHT
jgi:hypothetical protein